MTIDHRTNLRAAALTAAAVSLFAVSDAVVKLLTAAYPPGQILFGRGVFAVLLLGLVLRLRRGGPIRLPLRDRATWLRSLIELGATWCYFHALAALPLAEATAVLFVFPVLLTVLAALLLKEQVGGGRWSAVAAGLAGVLVIFRPGTAAFDPAALWALAAAAFIAGRDLATRFVRPAVGTEAVALMTTGFTTLASLATAPFGWAVPDGAGLVGFASSAALVSLAFLCLVAGTRVGDVSFTAPFRYVMVPLSFVLGFLIWGQVPDRFVLLGSLIIVAAGLAVLHRGGRQGRPKLWPKQSGGSGR
ncbi:MAG TPA: DMT family transporter [Geminicoccaceae bacterium]|nr:DMT family transporter [Geminicoccaceae bacterium]